MSHDIEVFFDGACPLCAREISLLRRLDRAGRIRFTDISSPDFASPGPEHATLMDRIHGRLPDGSWVEGVEVFRRLYAAVGFGPLVQLSRLPGVSHALDWGYRHFARNRLRWTGRCDTHGGQCEVPHRRSASGPGNAAAAALSALLALGTLVAAPAAFADEVTKAAKEVTEAPQSAAKQEPKPERERVSLEVEGGPLWIIENEGRYGAQGTLFSAREVGQTRNLVPAMRYTVEWRPAERHGLLFLYAPLDVTTRATLERDLTFRDRTFSAGSTVDHRYLFEGYRGSYLYRLVDRGAFRLDLGGSLQIRNAEVAFTDADTGSRISENDIGLVAAVKVRARYVTPWQLFAGAEADAISSFGVGVKGALYDAAVVLGVPMTDAAELLFRVRYVGGGAEVPRRDLYNWAHLLVPSLGVRLQLDRLLTARPAPSPSGT